MDTALLNSLVPPSLMQVSSWEEAAVQKIDNLLENFLGIRDSELG